MKYNEIKHEGSSIFLSREMNIKLINNLPLKIGLFYHHKLFHKFKYIFECARNQNKNYKIS